MKLVKIMSLVLILAFALTAFVQKSSYAAVEEGKYYKYLKSIYDQKNRKLNNFLIEECDKFLALFPTGPLAAEVRYVSGLLYFENGKYPEAVAAFLKGLFLDPQSERMNDEREQVRVILAKEKRFKNYAEKISRATEGPFIERNMSDKYFDYIKTLVDIGDEALYDWIIAESKAYAVNFPKSLKVEDSQTWVSKIYSTQEKYPESIASYEKIETLFPESQNIPANKLTVAKIRYMNMKDYDKAREDFKRVSEAYPGKEVAGDSFFYLGELSQKRYDDMNEAIKNYQTVANNYPSNKFAVESLFRVSDIYLKELKDNDRSIEALTKIGRDFSSDVRAPQAYDNIAEIYKNKMKDYDSAITTYKKLAETYPQNPISPQRLFKAAQIAEGDLKDYGNAISLYEDVKGMFPETKEAQKALKKISDLKKKMAKK
jgi:TolA-binding protein